VKLYFRWILGGMPARLLAIAARLIATSNSALSKRPSATMFSTKPPPAGDQGPLPSLIYESDFVRFN